MKYELRSTRKFDKWFSKIKDAVTKRRILARLARIENGNFGDFKLISLNYGFSSGVDGVFTTRSVAVA